MNAEAHRDSAGDLSRLPSHAFGPRALTWWGQAGLIAIEGVAFMLAAGAYLFLMAQEPRWPPNEPLPRLLWSTLILAVLLASEWPNVRVKRAAERQQIGAVRRGLLVMIGIGALLLALRGYEFTTLGVRWDENAYGSIVWALLVLHTVHLATDFYDTCVLAALMHTRHGGSPRRFVDVAENSLYWHFVVLTWVPLYLLVYWIPRLS
jgi:heme/copper-type cytochrome/quinol oxidase subunit 3